MSLCKSFDFPFCQLISLEQININTSTGEIEFAELSKYINKQKTEDICNYNVKDIEAAKEKKLKRNCIGKTKIHVVKDKVRLLAISFQ